LSRRESASLGRDARTILRSGNIQIEIAKL
jgi:hypothetical protein